MAKLKFLIKCFFALFFVFTGSLHFLISEAFIQIMPPYIPYPKLMVIMSGIIEITLGFILLFSKTQKWAAWGLILLLIAVFPANLHMALHPEIFSTLPLWGLYVRLPIQIILILWAYYYTRKIV